MPPEEIRQEGLELGGGALGAGPPGGGAPIRPRRPRAPPGRAPRRVGEKPPDPGLHLLRLPPTRRHADDTRFGELAGGAGAGGPERGAPPRRRPRPPPRHAEAPRGL